MLLLAVLLIFSDVGPAASLGCGVHALRTPHSLTFAPSWSFSFVQGAAPTQSACGGTAARQLEARQLPS